MSVWCADVTTAIVTIAAIAYYAMVGALTAHAVYLTGMQMLLHILGSTCSCCSEWATPSSMQY